MRRLSELRLSMTNYQRGYAAERVARKILEDDGYLVIRSAGSKGPADLIALNAREIILIQVKRNRPVSLAEQKRLIDLLHRIPENARIEIWLVSRGRLEKQEIGLGLAGSSAIPGRRRNA
jgi:Holliday junction resolvase